jgi:hypothetical protein
LAAIRSAPTTARLISALAQEVSRHPVRDDGRVDGVLEKLPGREPRALQEGASLVGEDAHVLARLVSGADDAERRPVTGGRERARVAVREDERSPGHERLAVASDRAAGGDVLLLHADRLVLEPLGDRSGIGAGLRGGLVRRRASSGRSPRRD